jgi:hypothetical protein
MAVKSFPYQPYATEVVLRNSRPVDRTERRRLRHATIEVSVPLLVVSLSTRNSPHPRSVECLDEGYDKRLSLMYLRVLSTVETALTS